MPTHIVPMLATLSEMPGDQSGYGFEYKWDGIRGMFFLGGERWRLETRNLIDVSHAYPEMIGLVDALADTRVVLDGEVITFDEKGSPSFGRLQHRLGIGEKKAKMLQAEFPVTYMIFDVLYLEGYTLMGLPFSERRDILEELGLEGAHWRTPPCYRGEGMPVLEAARENHLEGVMAKRLEGLYHPGLRTGDWRKIKLVDRQEFVVGGWTPISTGTKAMGALLVGYYEPAAKGASKLRGRHLVYAGKVGTGFSDRDRRELARALEQRRRDSSPFSDAAPTEGVHFAEPELVGEVEFRGWTNQGHLRQPSFKGLRVDKEPLDVVKEEVGA
jgi:bifunctional non-homologous end joining protein LigD